ncbi:MAG: excinuclease ABC subunit UvrA [Candidatus Azobacteroides pseudotrichonymphae]|jgi:excinuclease ABC subunit A|nr:MAG: excinuclease ABC subunit UvrA [Candidatus Azobacteroides pseudotrichonymphae]
MTKDKNTACIDIQGARVHNLKNINVTIPRNSFTVITGLSGSGKSSLAFDTLFVEGQRRYIDTFSVYARSFLHNVERPDVDRITGLSPVISIEQKTTNRSPRSTVGTMTEIYDYLRLLFARVGEAYSYISGEKMVKYTEEHILELIISRYNGKKVYLLSPIVKNRKGHYRELFEQFAKRGFLNVRIDGKLKEIIPALRLDRYKYHSVEVVIDKLLITDKDKKRIKKSVYTAMNYSDGLLMVLELESGNVSYFSRHLMCPSTGLSYNDPAPHNFSFNSPHGACSKCKGTGQINEIDKNLIMPHPELSIYQGGIAPLGKYREILIFNQLEITLKKYGIDLHTSLKDFSEEAINDIMNGVTEQISIHSDAAYSNSKHCLSSFEGIYKYILIQKEQGSSRSATQWATKFITTAICPECNGQRLNKEALHYRINGKNIADLTSLEIPELFNWINTTELCLNKYQKQIAIEILKEIRTRTQFLLNIGLNYLTLNRSSVSLSGGEGQRIRLATQIGSQLVNVLYILDEPSIGLHQRDNIRLIGALKQLRDIGNSVIVVEHDKEMIMNADYIVELGPKAGKLGGEIVFTGTPEELLKKNTLTASYISEKKNILISKKRKGNEKNIFLKGASGNNLKNVDIIFPLGKFICITGVSGSGKSTLINETLQPIISQKLYNSLKEPLPYQSIEGIENLDKIVNVDQSPIGRTFRSNPATYIGIFSEIRNLFTELTESKIKGYKPGHFSFNIKGGRCEVCKGNGYKTIEMNFLPNVYVPCEQCQGKRYNQAILGILYKGKSIADVLNMTINQAIEFFKYFPSINNKIKVLQEVGLGYICLGQPSTTLSGGESQRIKLATELSKQDTGKTLYILDEPTTGLHFEDIRVLLEVINRLVNRKNTVIIIEHNMEVIKSADYVIDMGPEGGRDGGEILFAGTPEQLIQSKKGYTSHFFRTSFI